KGLVEFSNCLVFRYSDVALQSFQSRVRSFSHGVGEFGFAASGWTLDQNRLLHSNCEIHRLESHGIDHVSCRPEFVAKFLCGRKHDCFLSAMKSTREELLSYAGQTWAALCKF